ncbi:hypothetical protein PAXRUDRAFT_823277 [Paxillus rubicundulus Ve08.2h10]|uniref:Uncharacterized protein n=1 Tax=Paxillus rubicundulus Ve08.2h10 TaxID=930991 RepID=A0A0D0E909_9AGAM|nr:hypothetical protein PAXRUDRAFT_823277 [Paxillus rubicundulus Ve08.2h10]
MHSKIFIVSFFDLVMIYKSSEFYTSVVTPYKPAAIMLLKKCLYRQWAEHLNNL